MLVQVNGENRRFLSGRKQENSSCVKMNWIHVNFYTRGGPETFDVSEDEFKFEKKRNWFLLLLKLTSVCSYIPTGIGILNYLLTSKDEG